jgi:hypothetical protein
MGSSLVNTKPGRKRSLRMSIKHPGMRVKHGAISAFTSIVVTLQADVFVYKIESCCKTMFRKKVLYAICTVLLV